MYEQVLGPIYLRMAKAVSRQRRYHGAASPPASGSLLARMSHQLGAPVTSRRRRDSRGDGPGGRGLPKWALPLRVAAFRRLLVGYMVNELGNWLGDIALAVIVYDRTGSPLATAGLFVGTRFLPALVAPALATRLESLPARRLLPVLYGLEAVLFAALAVVAIHFSLTAAIVLAALDGAVAITAKALTRAATATALGPHGLLRSGNALLNMGFTGLGAVGPVTAGVVVALASPAAALVVNAVTFAGVALIVAGLPVAPPDDDVAATPWRERLREGLAVVSRRGPVRLLLVGQACALLCFCAIVPIEVVYAVHSLHAGDAGYGALLTAWGLGMAVGGLGFASAGRVRLPLIVGIGTAGIGVAYTGMAVAPSLAPACAAAAIGGISNGIQVVAVTTLLQGLVPLRMQARVMAVWESMNALVPGVGFALGGAATALFSPRATFAGAGIGVLLITAVGLSVAARRRRAWVPPDEMAPAGPAAERRAREAARTAGGHGLPAGARSKPSEL
jgi:hypothetical protein